ncbi:CapA family protein [Geomonas oryzisoli]|uniref:CapA family protein n=1 Tax=Geomonas oryzisoli TaxID=2847992 RepID=A0ABX8J5M0_9BACT|nr:CapA family protein [Geomonas oryzisoli]QWV92371.1 CapA family protein [Geomonas oryzisoli]
MQPANSFTDSRPGTIVSALKAAIFLGMALAAPCFPQPAHAAAVRFYGDVLLSRGVEKFVRDTGGGEAVRQALAPFVAADALSVANLEGAVGDACQAGRNPCFPIRPEMLELLDGFNVVSLENNHALDTGGTGVERTAAALRRRSIIPLAGKKASALVETGGGTLAVLSATDVVNAAGDRQHLVAADDPQLQREIRRLKAAGTVVAVYVHWGRELIAAPTERMRELASRYVAAGADVVVGTHPHVPGQTACVGGRPVVWSLGNFLFDQKFDSTKKGAVLQCEVELGKLSCQLIGHETPRGSYLPALAAADWLASENAELAACKPPVTPSWTGRFGRSAKLKRLVQVPEGTSGRMSRLELYDLETGRREARTPPMPIRKVQPVDLNGDGIKEVMLIQEIFSTFDREVAKRVYLYSFEGSFHALWRGSALSRPLMDALFISRRNKKPILVALHKDETFLKRKRGTNRRTVMEYRWNGFGFSGNGEKPAPAGAALLREHNGKVDFVRDKS